jgi:ribosome-interacting GTPase 1
MPTNLPPEYYDIEERYRAAGTPQEKITSLEAMLSVIPKHKGTEKLIGDLRRRLSKLKAASETKKSVGRHESAFHIDPEGAGQVALVGCANVGKSALINALTNASPEVAAYPFTTRTPTPGMMPIQDIQVQIIDTPPLNGEFVEPELWNLIRRVDLIAVVLDLQAFPMDQLDETVDILLGHKIIPCQRRESYPQADRSYSFKPFILLANKCDDVEMEGDFEVLCELIGGEWLAVPVSAKTGYNLDGFKEVVFDHLDIIRVYSKPPGKDPDMSAPFVLKKGSTVEELAGKVHKDFIKNLKSARIWGSGAFDGQMVARDHLLQDGDVVELKA